MVQLALRSALCMGLTVVFHAAGGDAASPKQRSWQSDQGSPLAAQSLWSETQGLRFPSRNLGIHRPKSGHRNPAAAHAAASSGNGRVSADRHGRRLHRTKSANFLVDVEGPSKHHAELIAERAEHHRKEIALAWFGRELPTSKVRCLLYVTIDESQSRGQTLPSSTGEGSLVNIAASLDQATGPLLAHEISHMVLAYRFRDTMPTWASEGIASLYDSAERRQIVGQALERLVRERRWPDLDKEMNSSARTPECYAIAASLTQMLLRRGTREQFLTFVEDGTRTGWDHSVARHYGIPDMSAWQREWREWVVRAVGTDEFSMRTAAIYRSGRSTVALRSHTSSRF